MFGIAGSHSSARMPSSPMPVTGPELFLGLVGPIGTDLDALTNLIRESIKAVANYETEVIRLIQLLTVFERWKNLPTLPPAQYYDDAMTAGDDFRQEIGRGDALAILAMQNLREKIRSPKGGAENPIPRTAYIFRSLKHPDEVSAFRRTYGSAFILIGAYCPRTLRLDNLARKIAGSEAASPAPEHKRDAAKLLDRDESESEVVFGQAVRETFPFSDVFIDVSQPREKVRDALVRFFELLFGYPWHTPTRQEQGMFLASAASVRSSAMGRQVGAALCNADGNVLSIGTNEVPKAFGGQYWGEDEIDWRDFQLGYDSNDDIKRQNIAELLRRFRKEKWLDTKHEGLPIEALVTQAYEILKGVRVMSPIEYGRPVHAEMAALMDAARNGVSTRDTVLFSTTFPCHECARHIIAAGVQEVYFVEPYPKSLAGDLHKDAISIEGEGGEGKVTFRPFVGVAPRLYSTLYAWKRRKDSMGKNLTWNGHDSQPLTVGPSSSYFEIEDLLLSRLTAKMKSTTQLKLL
jgi:deoxycytidylate deaminase